jgi:hypothetical protein
MAHQSHQIQLFIASHSEIERTARQLTAIRDGYLTACTLTNYTPRPFIMEPWQDYTLDDMQLQLDRQKLRMNDAERLATAAEAVGASLEKRR